MKTKLMIIFAAIIFSVTIAQANPGRNLTFLDAKGRTLVQPLKADEAPDSIPFDIAATFISIRQDVIHQVFDISDLMKPEEEEPVPFDVQEVFRTAKK